MSLFPTLNSPRAQLRDDDGGGGGAPFAEMHFLLRWDIQSINIGGL